MADMTIVAAAIRPVTHDPEDVQDFDAGSGYTPALGDLVQCNGTANQVVAADSNSPARLATVGFVVAIKRTGQGTAGYRVTVLFQGLLQGFTSLPSGQYLYNSATAAKVADIDPTGSGSNGRCIGYAKNTTEIFVMCPAIPGSGGES